MTSYGINPQASLMHPCSHELRQTLALGHGGAVIIVKHDSATKTVCFLPNNTKKAHSIGLSVETSVTLTVGAGESGNKPTIVKIKY